MTRLGTDLSRNWARLPVPAKRSTADRGGACGATGTTRSAAPLRMDGDPYALSLSLDQIRGERSAMALFYVDASALVKPVRDEPGSHALRAFLADSDASRVSAS